MTYPNAKTKERNLAYVIQHTSLLASCLDSDLCSKCLELPPFLVGGVGSGKEGDLELNHMVISMGEG